MADQQQEKSVMDTVQEINESLSNSIPALVLLLMALQEQGRAPPAELPPLIVRHLEFFCVYNLIGSCWTNVCRVQ